VGHKSGEKEDLIIDDQMKKENKRN